MEFVIRAARVCALCLVYAFVSSGASGQSRVDTVGQVRVEADGSPGSAEVAGVCTAAARVLQARGWRTPATLIRVMESPFDATVPGSDLALAASERVDEAFFRAVEVMVRRELSRVAPEGHVDVVARLIAAHLTPPSSRFRRAWQEGWLASLARGELTETALVEAVWRIGGDDLLRAVVRTPWPEGLVAALTDRVGDDLVGSVADVVLAGLMDPAVLGFEAPPPMLPRIVRRRFAEDSQGAVGFGVHIYPLPARAEAEAIMVLRAHGVAAHAVVQYAVADQYDVVRLREGEEIPVPLRGVTWAGVVVTSLSPRGVASLATRPLAEYPVALERWDFEASGESVTISWETRRHVNMVGFVVEALMRGGNGNWRTLHREFLPVAQDGDRPFSYSYLETAGEMVDLYLLRALTRNGLLAEIATFPLLRGVTKPSQGF